MNKIFITAYIFLLASHVNAQTKNKLANYQKLIVGKWISTEDKESRLNFTQSGLVFQLYTGYPTDTSTYKIFYDNGEYTLSEKSKANQDITESNIEELNNIKLVIWAHGLGAKGISTYKRVISKPKKRKT